MNSLKLTATLNRKHIRPGRKATIYLLLDLEAVETKPKESRLPLNLGFVIDRSGSMSGEKLHYTKQAVQYAAGHLATSDTASLTVFDEAVEVLYPAQPLTLRDEFKAMVTRIFPGGCTNLSGGLLAGYGEVKKNVKDGQVNRVILLTDGLANEGIVEPEQLCKKVAGMRESGVAVTTLGVGDDFDEDLLTALAEQSGGNYYFIDSPDNIPAIFRRELQDLLSVVAQNVQLKVECSDAVSVSKVWNYRPSGDRTLGISLPDLVSCDRKLVVLELQVSPLPAGEASLGHVTLTYDDAGESLASVVLKLDLKLEATRDAELLGSPEESLVRVQLELCRTAEAREEALRRADRQDFNGAKSVMNERINFIAQQMAIADPSMQQELAEELAFMEASQLKFCDAAYDANSRKQMASRSYQRRSNKKP